MALLFIVACILGIKTCKKLLNAIRTVADTGADVIVSLAEQFANEIKAEAVTK
jgi:hypothetical protein